MALRSRHCALAVLNVGNTEEATAEEGQSRAVLEIQRCITGIGAAPGRT